MPRLTAPRILAVLTVGGCNDAGLTKFNASPVAEITSHAPDAAGNPPALYDAALRVLYYLYMHRHVGLHYEASAMDLSGMSDSDWAVKHSTSGWLFQYALAAITS